MRFGLSEYTSLKSKPSIHKGASTVKWTTLDPCLVFNERDTKLYTNFEFCEKKFKDILKHTNIRSQTNYDENQNSKKSSHILGKTCKWCASR